MYLTITPQKIGGNFTSSVADFVTYLEKENRDQPLEKMNYFFNQTGNQISEQQVIGEIDANSAKLRKTEPRYYSLTINPSQYELRHIQNNSTSLREYTLEVMKNYAKAFNREIEGKPVSIENLKFFAKIEYQRSYHHYDKEIRENSPYMKQIVKLEHDLVKIRRGDMDGDSQKVRKEISRLIKEIPHTIGGKPIKEGMLKPGLQTHVHVIVSRKDATNRYSLSPGSKYRSSTVEMHGRTVRRGFDRNQFFQSAERTFDRMFQYQRNYVEKYTSRKELQKNPGLYYSKLMRLPVNERQLAFNLLRTAGMTLPATGFTPAQVQLAIKKFRKAIGLAVRSSSIHY
ncbi:MobB family relaxase [Salinimicrobium sp. TIG7-5_MAKvit]|uniref:MobB family relaxase n=1 Tax=Salinimicrobium sp. TIG7-5_MAKvit TaxID=3121289 RepID=UPI003C6E1374